QDATQVARVDVDDAPQVRDLAGLALGELEQDPGLGERVGRIQVLAAQQADRVRVEPVERSHRRHRRVQFAHLIPRCRSLLKSTIYLPLATMEDLDLPKGRGR